MVVSYPHMNTKVHTTTTSKECIPDTIGSNEDHTSTDDGKQGLQSLVVVQRSHGHTLKHEIGCHARKLMPFKIK